MSINYNEREKIKIGVDYNMPNRKKPCLVVFRGNTETKYASFNDRDSAVEFMKIFCEFMNAEVKKEAEKRCD